MIDLHTHSNASDGELSPQNLLQSAKNAGIHVLALTDHDTISGLEEAENEAKALGITFINGVELVVEGPGGRIIHILGLGFNRNAVIMEELCHLAQARRHERNLKILEKIKESGYNELVVHLEETLSISSLCRPHIAQAMVRLGIVKSTQDAFSAYLRDSGKWFVPYLGLDAGFVFESIRVAGGSSFIAHPQSLQLSWKLLELAFLELQLKGLSGVEVWHPGLRKSEGKRLQLLAQRLGLRQSAGSDYHTSSDLSRVLGRSLSDKRKIDDSFLACLENTFIHPYIFLQPNPRG